jgi:hypothetical protein
MLRLAAMVVVDVRREGDWTQEDATERASWHRAKIQRIENLRSMTVGKFIVLAGGFEQELEHLLTRVLAVFQTCANAPSLDARSVCITRTNS